MNFNGISGSKVINCPLYSIGSRNYNKLRDMRYTFKIFATMLSIAFFTSSILAQYDDLYYDPSKDTRNNLSASFYEDERQSQNVDRELAAYDDQNYEYNLEEDGYHYSSRIRRFHRPVGNYDYFSPAYTESSFYDNCAPGRSIYMSGAFAHSFFSPFYGPSFGFGFGVGFGPGFGFGNPAFNPWGWGYNPYGWGFSPWGWGNPYNPWGWNPMFGMRPPFFGFGHCPVYYTNNYNFFYGNPGNSRDFYYGPRTSVSNVGTRDGRVATVRRAGIPSPGPAVADNGGRRSSITSDPNGNTRQSRTSVADPNSAAGNPRVNTLTNQESNRAPVEQGGTVSSMPGERNNMDRVSSNPASERYTRNSANNTNVGGESERAPVTSDPRYTRDSERVPSERFDRTSRERYTRERATDASSRYTRTARSFDRSEYQRPKRSDRNFTPYNRSNTRRSMSSGSNSPYLRDRSSQSRNNSFRSTSPRMYQRPQSTTPSNRFSPRSSTRSRGRYAPSRSSGSRTPSAMPRSSSGSRSSGSRSSSRRGG
jgi:hypothetical protein